MAEFKVNLKDRSYPIVVGDQILPRLGEFLCSRNISSHRRDAVIITNPPIFKIHGKKLLKGLKKDFSFKVFQVPDSETSKSVEVAFSLINQIVKYDIKKKIFIIAFGGGVVGDLAGFIAAVYKRGIPYIQVPTTFLAQIDSAIGGKVAIDLSVGKNLVGAFHQPRLVFSDTNLLQSLDLRQRRNGLAEAVKYGVIRDQNLFSFIEKHCFQLLEGQTLVLNHVIESCSRIKAQIVSQDEKETEGIRTILNFGHTVGHAIEVAGGYERYAHGEAIALGMRVASEISRLLKLTDQKVCERVGHLLDEIKLPSRIQGVSKDRILKAIGHDKKNISGKNRLVLLRSLAHVEVVEGVPLSAVEKALKKFL